MLMKRLIIQHTNRLIKCATKVAQDNNIKVIPYPNKQFSSNKSFEKYLGNLTNFIERPELFYRVKDTIPSKEHISNTKIPASYFKYIKN